MIVILTGHGGKDKGSSSNTIYENDLNYTIAKNCVDIIKENTDKYIWLNPDKNTYMDIPTRGRILKNLGEKYKNCDVFCIHCDWSKDSSVNGISIIKSVWNNENDKVYIDFMNKIEQMFGIKKRKVWTRNYKDGNKKIDHYGVHRLSGEYCIVKIIECGFISNKKDREILLKEGKEIGIEIGKMILSKNEIKIKPKVLYSVQVGAFSDIKNAVNLQNQLKLKGFESIIKKEG